MRLEGLDLNLLVVLDALLAESSVTEAAKRLCLSQSATSHALARLRSFLDDPILVRTANEMVVTPRAAELVVPVRRILENAEQVLQGGAAFDPKTSNATFRIGLESAAQLTIMPALVAHLQQVAPGIALFVVPTGPDRMVEAFDTGAIDLALTPFVVPSKKGLSSERLVSTDYVCIARKNHPSIGKRLTLDQFLAADHVTVDYPNLADQAIEAFLTERGASRRIQLTVSTPATIPVIVSRSDLVATVPRALLEFGDAPPGLLRRPPPIELEPVTVHLVYHERTEGSTPHAWLFEQIRVLLREMVDH